MRDLLLEFLDKILNEAPKGMIRAAKTKKTKKETRPPEAVFASGGRWYKDAEHTEYVGRYVGNDWVPATDAEKAQAKLKATGTRGFGKDFVGKQGRGIMPQQPTLDTPITGPTKQPRTRQAKTSVTPRQKTSPSKERERMDGTVERAVSTLADDPAFGYLPKNARRFRAASFLRLKAIAKDTSLSSEQLRLRDELETGLQELLRLYSSNNKRDKAAAVRLANELNEKFEFFSNESGKAFKTVVFGNRHRHVVGKGAGGKATNLAGDMVKIFGELGIDLRKAKQGDKVYKNTLDKLSKLKLGKISYGYETREGKGKNAVRIPPDPVVSRLFSKPPLSNLPQSLHALYGPQDENGRLVDNSGGKNARVYFEHGIQSNSSMNDTIAYLEQEGVTNAADALRGYQERMQEILDNWDSMTPAQRKKAVQQAHATMATELARADPESCGAVLKNLAEMNLYQQEIANNEEAYLPAAGTFPGADKIVVTKNTKTKGERVAGISVKFGKKGLVFGFPAQTGKLMMWHPDKYYHDISTVRPGSDGFETGIRSDALDQKNWDKMMETSEYASVFSKKDNATLRSSFQGLERCMQGKKRNNNSEIIDAWKECTDPEQPHMKRMDRVLRSNMDKLTKLLGVENAEVLERNPEAFSAMLAFHSALRTSDGLSNLQHNHQTISQEQRGGPVEYVDETESGSTDYRHWHCQFRATDDRGGGLICGFSKETKAEK